MLKSSFVDLVFKVRSIMVNLVQISIMGVAYMLTLKVTSTKENSAKEKNMDWVILEACMMELKLHMLENIQMINLKDKASIMSMIMGRKNSTMESSKMG
jgi:hypothetical protein